MAINDTEMTPRD